MSSVVIARPWTVASTGRPVRRPTSAGEDVRVRQVRLDHVDAARLDQRAGELDRLPRRLVGDLGDDDVGAELAQTVGERALERRQHRDAVAFARQALDEAGDVVLHAADDRVADDLQDVGA